MRWPDTQRSFAAALRNPEMAVPPTVGTHTGGVAEKRFNVYRNNTAVSLTEALEVSFPAVVRLLGAENFKKVAGVFLRRHPPKTPMIMYYGDEFPEFLETFEPLQHIGYLPDVAKLEQALRQSYHAADVAPVDHGAFQALPPEALGRARLALAPAVGLVRSPWPVHAIWTYNMEDGAPKPQAEAQNVLITRPDFDPEMTPVNAGTAAFVAALSEQRPLADAGEIASEADAKFDLSQALGLLLAGRAITSIKTGDT